MIKRGFTHAEAMAYVGVKRRTFDELWRPHLVAMAQGACLVYDKEDLDRLFDEFKQEAAGQQPAANDAGALAHNGPRNGRPAHGRGELRWAKQHGASTPRETDPGKSTSGSGRLDFDSAVSLVLTKRNAG